MKPLDLAGRLGWVAVGALALYTLRSPTTITYPEVVVPAARIVEREVPSGPPRFVDRMRYVYLRPEVRAVAPGGVVEDVARFCRPITLVDSLHESVKKASPSVIRSIVHTPAFLPLARDGLLVTSMDGWGDLVAEDFRVRPGFGVAAGLTEPYRTTVRYSRLAPLRELGEGLVWYGAFRAVEALALRMVLR